MTIDLAITSTDLEEAAQEVLQGFPPTPTAPPEGSADPIEAQIELFGEDPAVLTIAASPPAAAALAVAFFGAETEGLTPFDLIDAVKESANVIGGAVKPLVGVLTTLSIPTVDIEQVDDASWDAEATVDYAGGTLSLRLRMV
jgi:hypothetical protein